MRILAIPPNDGAFKQFVTMPASFVHPVPDVISDDASVLLEPLSVGVWACSRRRRRAGPRVLVTGAGPIGLIAAQAARALGADSVTATDVNLHPLAPADSASPPSTSPRRPSPIAGWNRMSKSSAPATLPTLALRAGPRDRPHRCVPLRNTWPTAFELAGSGRLDLDSMVTGHYRLTEVETALTATRSDPTAVKVIVRPGG